MFGGLSVCVCVCVCVGHMVNRAERQRLKRSTCRLRRGLGRPKERRVSWGPNLATFNTWFLGPTRVFRQTASRSVQPFLQGSLVCPTDTQTKLQVTVT